MSPTSFVLGSSQRAPATAATPSATAGRILQAHFEVEPVERDDLAERLPNALGARRAARRARHSAASAGIRSSRKS